uniref:Uncharacterized protein n=1 Tax=viral metagenome TaxID=1070528 RepID=A0A6C0HTY4_9ZZZZ
MDNRITQSGEPRFPLKPPPFMMYLILIIRLTSSFFKLFSFKGGVSGEP